MAMSLIECFLDHAARQPEATALLAGQRRVTYAGLRQAAAGVAGQLAGLVPAGDAPLGLLAEKSPDAVAVVLGCLLAGRRFVLPSPDLGEAALARLFEAAGCRTVLAPAAQRDRFAGKGLDLAFVGTDATGPAAPHPAASRDEIGFMLTTSGSTGLPKVVPLPSAAVDRFIAWAGDRFDIRPGRTVFNYAPLNFDLCLLDIWTSLARGATVVLVAPELAANAAHLADLMTATPVHVVQGVPMMYRLIIEEAQRRGVVFAATRHVLFTGDSMPSASLAALPRLFPGAELHNIYGCTETNDSFIHTVDLAAGAETPLPIGAPLPGVDALILDAADGLVAGAGAGELVVATPFQTPGYLDPTLNGAKFMTIGGSPRIFFRSGDIVRRREDGALMLEGRKDFQVKVRGTRVNLQEVEQALLDHEQVMEAAVVAVPDDLAGHRLHAVVRRRAAGLNSLALRQHCAPRLVRAAIPSSIEIVDGALPRTSTGKIDRRRILHSQLEGV